MIKDPDDSKDQRFLSRWSKRKKAVAEDSVTNVTSEEAPEVQQVPLNTITPSAATGKMLTGVEADRLAAEASIDAPPPIELTDEDMPDIDSLDENSDFSGFMSPGVSATLRKLALRKLFGGAGFNIRDGLDDYDDDFTKFEALGDIITSDMKHRIEVEARKKREAEEAAEAERIAAGETQQTDTDTLENKDSEEVVSEDKSESAAKSSQIAQQNNGFDSDASSDIPAEQTIEIKSS